jgi:uncharacterized membrane protein YkoI
MFDKMKTKLITPLLAISVLAGSGAAVATLASADTSTADTAAQTNITSTTNATQSGQPQFDPAKGGHVGANGTKEELLTGDTAAKATAAALAAVPGGTIERVETDAEGATYEAHMTKSDGSRVTVKMDASFNVTGTEQGFGGPRGQTQAQ